MAWQPHRVCLTLEAWLCQQSRTRQLDTPVMECMDRTECSIHFSQYRLRAHSSALHITLSTKAMSSSLHSFSSEILYLKRIVENVFGRRHSKTPARHS